MSRLRWRSRSVLAAGAAAVLVGSGVAALATTGPNPAGDPPSASAPQPTDGGGLTDVRRSLDDLMAQAAALESSLAATPTPSPSAPAPVAGQSVPNGSQSFAAYDDDDDHGDDDDGEGGSYDD